jgi:hypothetical protein
MNNTNKLTHLNSNLSMGNFESRDDSHEIPMNFFIFKGLQNPDAMYRLRSLLIFQHVVKMMASKRLCTDKENFREVFMNALARNWLSVK